MKNSECVHDFSTRVSLIVNQARSLGKNLPNQMVVKKVLGSLPPKFDHVIAAIEELKDLANLSLVSLIDSLKAHEQQMNTRVEVVTEQMFQVMLSEKEGIKSVFEDRSHKTRRG